MTVLRQLLAVPAVRVRHIQLLCFLLSFSGWTAGFALFCERRLSWHGTPFGTAQVAWLLAYVGLLGLVAQLGLLGRLVRDFGEARLARWSLIACSLGYALMASAHDAPVMLLALTCTAIGNALVRPSILGIMSMQISSELQGALSGVAQSLQTAAMVISPIVAGLLIQSGWLSVWALLCSSLTFVACLTRDCPSTPH